MGKKIINVLCSQNIKGSLTVEAAIIFPILLLCIFWTMEKGISLYEETIQCINNQEIWEEFHPAEDFRKLEMLKKLF